MIKVFIITPWFAPAFRAGGPVQSLVNMVNQYYENISYQILCSNNDVDGTVLTDVAIDQWVKYNDNTSVWYTSKWNTLSSIRSLMKDNAPDVLYIVGIYSLKFNIIPLLFCKAPKKILSVRGMMHPGALSQKKWKKKLYLSLLNLLNIQKNTFFHVTDEIEEQYVKYQMGITARIIIAGNFPNKLITSAPLQKNAHSLSMVSIALISPMKNYLLVLKSLQHSSAHIEYHICGAIKDHSYWEECLQQIKQLPSNINVVYHGEVEPTEMTPFLERSHIAILPSKSENFGHSIYEALSVGKPVITSFGTPWLNLKHHHAGLNVNPETNELQNAIEFFANMNNDDYQHWVLGAGEYAAKAIDREKLKQDYNVMWGSVV